MISLLVVDDQDLVRSGIRLIVEQAQDMAVVGEAADGAQAVREVHRHRPDVVLMDVRMPAMDGIEATRRICALAEPPRVIMLTTFELDQYVFDALEAGASGFLLKRTTPEALVDGIRTVAAGDGLLSPSVTRRLIEEFAQRPTTRARDPRLDELTEREAEVLRHMALGRNNGEIADELVVSEHTVKTHVRHVLAKLGARDRAQAIVCAYNGGLMDE